MIFYGESDDVFYQHHVVVCWDQVPLVVFSIFVPAEVPTQQGRASCVPRRVDSCWVGPRALVRECVRVTSLSHL